MILVKKRNHKQGDKVIITDFNKLTIRELKMLHNIVGIIFIIEDGKITDAKRKKWKEEKIYGK